MLFTTEYCSNFQNKTKYIIRSVLPLELETLNETLVLTDTSSPKSLKSIPSKECIATRLFLLSFSEACDVVSLVGSGDGLGTDLGSGDGSGSAFGSGSGSGSALGSVVGSGSAFGSGVGSGSDFGSGSGSALGSGSGKGSGFGVLAENLRALSLLLLTIKMVKS